MLPFSPVHTVFFSTLHKTNFNFSVAFTLSSANALNLDKVKALLYGRELTEITIYPFPTMFQKLSLSGSINVRIM